MQGSRQTVLVTGATGGIGSAVCHRLVKDGYRVWAIDLDQVALDNLIEALPGTEHRGMVANLRDLESHQEVIREVTVDGAKLLGLIHLAAVLRRRPSIDDISEDDWDFQIDTNLKATFFLNRTVAQFLIKQSSGGSIVNFTSQAWWSGGYGGSVVYAATKGGIVSMSRGLARTLAPHQIRVNTIAPGFVDTPMMRSGLTEEQLAQNVAQVPLGRLAAPEEIADAAVFLACNDARYITGATLNLTGGQLMY